MIQLFLYLVLIFIIMIILFIYHGQMIYYRDKKQKEREQLLLQAKNATKPCFLNSCDKTYVFKKSSDQL